jgi:hypothetical protein
MLHACFGALRVLAVLIDADNLSANNATRIIDWCRARGPLLAVRLFGNFASNQNAEWAEIARLYGFEIVFQTTGGTGKNSTDIALVIHAMDLMHEGVVTGFCLASNDRDFVPLATRLRRSGRKVLAIGERLDERLKSACHDFFEIPLAAKPKSVAVPPLVAAYRRVAQNQPNMRLGQLAQLLRVHAPEVVPTGAGKLRKSLRESGWFAEEGSGAGLTIVLKPPA